jgi:hypothetical protein
MSIRPESDWTSLGAVLVDAAAGQELDDDVELRYRCPREGDRTALRFVQRVAGLNAEVFHADQTMGDGRRKVGFRSRAIGPDRDE